MSQQAHRSQAPFPLTVGGRCKRCGGALAGDILYVIVKQAGNTSVKQDHVCLECLGELLLTSDKVVESLAARLLEVLEKRSPR